MIAALFCTATIWTDLAYRRVPNALLLAVLLALGLALLTGNAPEPGLGVRLLGAGLGTAVTLPVYALGRMAAGDVKFLAVAGLFAGPQGLVTAWVVGNLLGLAHALLAWAASAIGRSRRKSGNEPRNEAGNNTGNETDNEPTAGRQLSKARGIPYAAYLAIGLLVWMAGGA